MTTLKSVSNLRMEPILQQRTLSWNELLRHTYTHSSSDTHTHTLHNVQRGERALARPQRRQIQYNLQIGEVPGTQLLQNVLLQHQVKQHRSQSDSCCMEPLGDL